MTRIGVVEMGIVCLVGLVLLVLVAGAIWLIVSRNKPRNTIVCTNCGRVNPAENSYCGNCGKPLSG